MSAIRSFIAIDLSAEIQARLDDLTKELKKRLPDIPVRWVPAKNIHLTLKFLGDVSEANIEVVKKFLRAEANNHAPFEISVGELGAFPSNRRPRVLWVGIQAPPELAQLHRGVEAETTRLGYAPEERDFSPHLTLGRVARNASSNDVQCISRVLNQYKVGFLGATRIQAVHLFRSDLRPGGAVYTSLYSAPLRSAQA